VARKHARSIGALASPVNGRCVATISVAHTQPVSLKPPLPPLPSPARRIAGIAVAVVFALFAAAQWNDPDPWRWMPLYGLPAAIGVAFARGVVDPPWLLRVFAAAYALLAWLWAPAQLVDPFQEVAMTTPAIEDTRECLGLVIVAVMLAILSYADARAATARRAVSAPRL
jgi:hypothetical protein